MNISFQKIAITLMLAILVCQIGCGEKTSQKIDAVQSADSLESGFASPPDSARARTWWHWINGIVSKEGISRDLEAIKQAGIGGVHLFQQGDTIQGPVQYGSEENMDLMHFAAQEADRLGLEFTMSNTPGCAGSGGPWITPELSMQQLVWSEAFVSGGNQVKIMLQKPYANLGYYQDSLVLAFPSLKGEEKPMRDTLKKISSNSGAIDDTILTDYDLAGGVEVTPGSAGQSAYVQLEFSQPFTARSIFVHFTQGNAGGPGGGPAPPGGPPGAGSGLALEASDNGAQFRKISDLTITRNTEGPVVPVLQTIPTVEAKFFRILFPSAGRVSEIQLNGAVRFSDWARKINLGGWGASRDVLTGAEPQYTDDSVIAPESVVDISKYMNAQGELDWQAPEGNWTILRIGHTSNGTKGHPQPEGGQGLECDKFSKEAMDFHFDKMFGDMISTLAKLKIKGLTGGLIDSYEAGLQNWTAKMPEEFQKRRGYSIVQYMPALSGRIVGNQDITDRFLWDLRRTQADLMADNYYGRFAELCKEHGMISYAEPYGGPFEEMQSGSRVDVPMGEFWTGTGLQGSVKTAASIAHTYGKSLVGAESFTSQPTFSKWQEYPYSLKAQGDWMFTQGLNQMVFHQYVHQANTKVAPGLTMRSVGSLFSVNATWWNQSRPWQDYLARCQYMLSQGLFVADVLYYNGEDIIESGMRSGPMNPALPKGYDYDTVNSEVLLTRASIKDGCITMPDGASYSVLVLPDKKLTPEMLSRIRDLTSQGMRAVVTGRAQTQSPSLAGYPENDNKLKDIAAKLWGDMNGTTEKEHSLEAGTVFWGMTLKEVLDRLNIKPDFEFTSRSGDAPISYIHKQIEGGDVYFVTNRRRQSAELVCDFRVSDKQPELWNPDTGKITPVDFYELVDGRVRMPLHLDPAGSTFVVFRSQGREKQILKVDRSGNSLLSTEPFASIKAGRYPDVKNNFTISVWVKPEVDISLAVGGGRGFGGPPGGGGVGFLFYPPSGEEAYGRGHSANGLTVGRNGICLYERSGNNAVGVLAAAIPIEGWSHVAVVYKDSTPSIYVNGKLAATGRKSGSIVHPGVNEAFEASQGTYLIGDVGKLELLPKAMSEDEINLLAGNGVPDVEEPPVIELAGGSSGEMLFWQDGVYSFKDNQGGTSTVEISGIGQATKISVPWEVRFTSASGAPTATVLDELMSLHKNSEEGIRYFSGTATYTTLFNVEADATTNGKRLFLDLGRVEVSAEVLVNDRNLGILWKPPYQVDITDAVRVGVNDLEVRVANLWPNRLIGDEQLPEEVKFGPETGEQGNQVETLPDWYLKNEAKPGARITFASWKHYSKDSPLLESGLLGPVRLRTAVRKAF